MHHPPPRPTIAPLIAQRYPNDVNGDHVDDQLFEQARRAVAANHAAATADQKAQAEARLSQKVEVELIFKEPVTRKQMDAFLVLGGEITYVYRAVSYGWNGRIGLNKINAVPAKMGASLVLLDGPQQMAPTMLEATRTGRVRPIWAPGFAGSVSGFEGNTNITIAILDAGIDATHPDLAGRGIYTSNFTSEPFPAAGDVAHGSHVAGIALGSGASAGSGTGTLRLTAVRTLDSQPINKFFVDPIELPTNTANISATAQWNGGSVSGTRFRWWQRLGTDPVNIWSGITSTVGPSPLTLNFSLSGLADAFYSPGLIQSNGITDYVITSRITNYPGIDGFNKLRGVAPACKWADARIALGDGSGSVTWANAAIDDLVDKRIEKNIKVMNISRTVSGDPGVNLSLRQKISSAVNNGIVVVAACGNDFRSGNASHEIDDPGRASLALTVAGANDINQLTDYSSHGFNPAGPEEQDFKPDLMAPGGSQYHTLLISVENNANDNVFPEQQLNDYESLMGTSRAAPFAAGCAALVIDAMQKSGQVWEFNSSQHSLFVKMVLCATASESNQAREAGGFDPTLERAGSGPNGYPAGKDPNEGYGMINPDGAVEAVSLVYTNGVTNSATLGQARSDPRVWARTVVLEEGHLFAADLIVPVNGDFDVYLYNGTPTTNGTPVILASGTQAGGGVNEMLNYLVTTNGTALLVVKRVSGSGAFNFIAKNQPPPRIIAPGLSGDEFTFSFDTVPGRTYGIEFKDSFDEPLWQALQSVSGDGTLKTVTNFVSSISQRFFRLNLQ